MGITPARASEPAPSSTSRAAFQSLFVSCNPCAIRSSLKLTSWAEDMASRPQRTASAPYFSMSTSGSGELPRLLLILRPSLSRMMPVK